MNRGVHRIVWSRARNSWVVAGEYAMGRGKRSRGRRAGRVLAGALTLSLGMQAAAPLTALAQGVPSFTGKPAVATQEEQGEAAPDSVQARVAAQVRDMARRQASGAGQADLDAAFLKEQGQAQFNQFLQGGVRAANQSGMPFLRHLRGDLRHDFDSGRTSVELRTIDEVYRAGANTGLLQLGAHNQNDRPTANLGAVYRRDVNESLMLGANAFLDYEFGKQHVRGSLGLEAAVPEFSLHGNLYAPLSGWKGAKRDGRREERPASGMDVGMKYSPAFAPGLELKASYFRWNGAGVDYFDDGRPQNRATGFKTGVQYRPVPLVGVGLEHTKVQNGGRQTSVQVGLQLNLSEPLARQLQRPIGAPAFDMARHRHALVERENRIVLDTRRKHIVLPLALSSLVTDARTGRIVVSGMTEARAMVDWTLPDGSIGRVQANAAGVYRIESVDDQPSGEIRLRASNADGDSSRELVRRYEDEMVPGAPEVAIVAIETLPGDRKVRVRGTTAPRAIVLIAFPGGEQAQVRADEQGAFSAASRNRLPRGEVIVRAKRSDAQPEAVVRQMYEPAAALAPTIDGVRTDPVSGRVTVTGRAQPNSRVVLRFSDGTEVTADTDAKGQYRAVSANDLPAGELRVSWVPRAGEQALSASYDYQDQVGKGRPEAPRITKVETAADSGAVTVAGEAMPGARVKVAFPDGTHKDVVADAKGLYSATSDGDMRSGTIRVSVTDASGRGGAQASSEYVDTVDKTPPPVAIGSVSTDPASGVVTVEGTTEPAASVAVAFPDGTVVRADADGNGRYRVSSPGDVTKSGAITATASDGAGNRSTGSHEYVDKIAAAPPEVRLGTFSTNSANGHVTIEGTATPGTEIRVSLPGGSTVTATAGSDGGYRVDSGKDIPRGAVEVVASRGGVSSTPVRREYVDEWMPGLLTVTVTDPFQYLRPGTDPADFLHAFAWSAGPRDQLRVVVTPRNNSKEAALLADYIRANVSIGAPVSLQTGGTVQELIPVRFTNPSVSPSWSYQSVPDGDYGGVVKIDLVGQNGRVLAGVTPAIVVTRR
ncbi:inverse autotransporter beta domain-containing protein [Bordetella bronchiseptica]|uniref:inverse autotransporter beta domain-containing protein n=1 Tax=Bordetella bronchiseptica TaxID=518 RepID=UPI000461EE0A|nr:inverse autotransporter beta-barrel domain-containing protein [Bordetella bronchiseptica]KDD13576.1 PF11924 family protein [Bordetella bronchiseptica MBORD707]